ncbi:MAG: hypothetical protein AAGI01_11575 [Myxococcota bacterium]
MTLLMLLMSVGACRNTRDDVPVVQPPTPPRALDGFDDWAIWAPEQAVVLAVFDGQLATELLTAAMPPERAYNIEARSTHAADLRRDFGRTSLDLIGLDLAEAERIVLAASESWQTMLVFGKATINTGDATISVGAFTARPVQPKRHDAWVDSPWVIQVSATPTVHVLFPSRRALDAYLKEPKSLMDAPERKSSYERLFERAPALGGTVAVILDDPELRAEFQSSAPIEPPTALLASLSEDIFIAMFGEPGSLDGTKAAYENAVSVAGLQMSTSRNDAVQSGDPAALYLVLAFHTFHAWRDSVVIERPTPTELHFRAPSPLYGPQGAIGLTGLLGAAAYFTLGAFADTLSSSWTLDEEPYREKRAGPASMVEFMPDITGQLEAHFSKGPGCAPPADTASPPGGIEACCAAPGATPLCAGFKWDGPGWKDIGFSIPGTHAYVYSFKTVDLGYGEFETLLTATTKTTCGDEQPKVYEVVVYATTAEDGTCQVSVGEAIMLYPE